MATKKESVVKSKAVSKTEDAKEKKGESVADLQLLREEMALEALSKGRKRRALAKGFTPLVEHILLPPRVIKQIADEVATRISSRRKEDKKTTTQPKAKIADPLFLDTSAIIDERIFELVKLGVFWGNLVLLESVLSELKHIADLKDDVKKERGKRALKALDEARKLKTIKLITIKDVGNDPVDDKLIDYAKKYKGRVITCDFNLSRKARISNVVAIDVHEVANSLKTQAIPGETFWVKVIQSGKGEGQGVGYLPDGTMIVVENGIGFIGKTIQVTVSRIIQTEAGKILFSKIQDNPAAVAS